MWDQLERKFVSKWLRREQARTVRDTIEMLTPGASEAKYWNDRSGQMTRRFVESVLKGEK